MAVERSDVAAAANQFSALEPLRGTMPTILNWVMSVDHLLGLLAQTIGNLDQSAGHFEDDLAFSRKAGYRPELVWTCCDYADMLLGRNNEGDRAKAVFLLDESLAISSELGMRPLMERALSRREILNRYFPDDTQCFHTQNLRSRAAASRSSRLSWYRLRRSPRNVGQAPRQSPYQNVTP